MPTLSAEQRAAIVAEVSAPSIAGEQLMDLYRSPAASGGKIGAAQLQTEEIPIRLRPAGDAPKLVALAMPVNAARVEYVGKVAAGTDVQLGDEARIDGQRYKIEGVGAWSNATLIALTQIKRA